MPRLWPGLPPALMLPLLGLVACGQQHVSVDPFTVALSVPPPDQLQVDSATLQLRCVAPERGLARLVEPVYGASEQDIPLTVTVEPSDAHRGSRTRHLLKVGLPATARHDSALDASKYASPECSSAVWLHIQDPQTGSKAVLALENYVDPAEGAHHAKAYVNALNNGSLDSWYERESLPVTEGSAPYRYSFVVLFSGHANASNRVIGEAVTPLHWCGANALPNTVDDALMSVIQPSLREETECQTYHGRLELR